MFRLQSFDFLWQAQVPRPTCLVASHVDHAYARFRPARLVILPDSTSPMSVMAVCRLAQAYGVCRDVDQDCAQAGERRNAANVRFDQGLRGPGVATD
jgi:hypothetical protein